ncbi:DsrE family protein [Candidatus Woesearchaeota archaeon]|nr:DsrE family protein [Candidatus Woesearchaeota archaeon]
MKLGIIVNTNDAETCWNCFRLGNEALKMNHSVKIFLLGKGVEIEQVKDAQFPLLEGSIKKFVKNKGIILACGTCLQIRGKEESGICPISTMEELLKLVEESDQILTFG